ncbi:SPOR domain-containing protein [Salidesulfovibrio onnuriiensis]|uniref:SPOR domain-containing protein n=1 Tax=Salidesulfovibrio onnuriiensis TaxID=2583823 RepID=UPI0011CC07E0|nr:SPOR domain-containing protein [Salidesulfovibrio onnuriiensis]
MNKYIKLFALLLLATALAAAGCARKSIETTPPVTQQPAPQKPAKVVKKPAVVEKPAPKVVKEPAIQETDIIEQDLGPFKPSNKGLAYIQVGAYADQVGAKAAMSRLIADGYKGSRFSKNETDGFFRVQAGVFPDRETAERALKKLRVIYPDSFILIEKTKKEAQ